MFHHHGHETQLSPAEREELLRDGTSVQGLVVHSESAADPRISQVRVSVRFKDGQTVEFSEELADLWQPEAGSPEALRLAETRAAEQLRLRDYIQREQEPKRQPADRQGAGFGPPWAVPAHCPNCGGPVDQAKASRDPDPLCQFCHQPVPVTPLR